MASEGQDRADALGWGRCPNRPKTFARYHTIPQKVTTVSIHDKGPEPVSHGSSDPRREAGAPSTGGWVVPAPPGIVMVAPSETLRNASMGQSLGRAGEGRSRNARPGAL